jgi:hypothetical protein
MTRTSTFFSHLPEIVAVAIMIDIPCVAIITTKDIPAIGKTVLIVVKHLKQNYMFIEGQTSITLKNYPILRSLNPQSVLSAELESDLVRMVTALDERDTSAKDVQGWNFLISEPLTYYFAPGSANVGVGPSIKDIKNMSA